ncbi:hypothetical protein TUBRATIS_23120 [Tubulinosema ratisbonensis]|uniref:Uncharacterized protein n=1 Tax=Tubulinosema ratisbonensis TaxID=291195 RepID=A0A437AJA3_9MICR|nr:hypothetical protein TUBRATIS_23120 [Tubulinosema ratisbonensis]
MFQIIKTMFYILFFKLCFSTTILDSYYFSLMFNLSEQMTYLCQEPEMQIKLSPKTCIYRGKALAESFIDLSKELQANINVTFTKELHLLTNCIVDRMKTFLNEVGLKCKERFSTGGELSDDDFKTDIERIANKYLSFRYSINFDKIIFDAMRNGLVFNE